MTPSPRHLKVLRGSLHHLAETQGWFSFFGRKGNDAVASQAGKRKKVAGWPRAFLNPESAQDTHVMLMVYPLPLSLSVGSSHLPVS